MRNMKPIITINKKTGKFFINRAAALLFGLSPYERVEIFQDRRDPTIWGMNRVFEGGSFLRSPYADMANGYYFNNVKLAKEILLSVGCEDESMKVPVENHRSPDGWQWILLTNSLLD